MIVVQTTETDDLDIVAGTGSVLLADGFEAAFIGVAMRFGWYEPVAVYDYNKCIEILMGDAGVVMSYEEALEHFNFNIIGAWVGEQTPIFIAGVDLETLNRHCAECAELEE